MRVRRGHEKAPFLGRVESRITGAHRSSGPTVARGLLRLAARVIPAGGGWLPGSSVGFECRLGTRLLRRAASRPGEDARQRSSARPNRAFQSPCGLPGGLGFVELPVSDRRRRSGGTFARPVASEHRTLQLFVAGQRADGSASVVLLLAPEALASRAEPSYCGSTIGPDAGESSRASGLARVEIGSASADFF